MPKVVKTLAILTLAAVMAACGLQQHVKYTSVAGYPYRYDDFDYKYAWKTATRDQDFIIDGVMKNVRYSTIDSVQLTVFVLGKNENVIARASTLPMPQLTRAGDLSYFSLLLKETKPVPGDVYQILVHYSGNEGGNNGGINWISSFKVDAMTGRVIHAQGRNPDDW